jgi:hypothetical protein
MKRFRHRHVQSRQFAVRGALIAYLDHRRRISSSASIWDMQAALSDDLCHLDAFSMDEIQQALVSIRDSEPSLMQDYIQSVLNEIQG